MLRGAGLLLCLGGCASTADVLALADASGEQRMSAAREAADILEGGRNRHLRAAAAIAIGRLEVEEPAVLRALESGVSSRSEPMVQDASAWALGRMSASGALGPLVNALETRPSPELGRRVMQSLLRHEVGLAAAEPGLRVRVAEALVRYAGSFSGGRAPPELELLGRVSRDLEVDLIVLARALEDHRASPSEASRGALYAAALELLVRVDRLRVEVPDAARGARMAEALEAAIEVAGQSKDEEIARLVTWYMGRLADTQVLARSAGRAVLAAPDLPGAGDRLVRAWALARAQLGSLEARRALSAQVLGKEIDPELLRALDTARGQGAEDILQRVLGLEVQP